MPRATKIHDPYLNDFIYAIIFNCDHTQKKSLPEKFQKIFRSDSAAKSFATKSTLEDKEELMTLLGYNFYRIISQTHIASKNHLNKVIREFAENKRAEGLQMASEMNLFFTSDTQIAYYLGLISQVQHHVQYKVNLNYMRAAFHLQNWESEFEHIRDENVLMAEESAGYIARLFYQIMDAYDGIENFNMLKHDIKVLLYLYQHKTKYVKLESIITNFSGSISQNCTQRAVRRLHKNEYVRQSPTKEITYTITSTGIGQVNNFFSRVFKATNF